ncbi:dTDP-4-dehydrorhamnose reductase [Aurantimicrobium minutum]|uniref:dTDP-4-dehydrorhamnose reductase n=1 Tax=Aurantimicrobium minutum TaxID=708131 RepID=UPI002476867E|nr:dTDP-4-dehydrorhamnose reductase [Aurantimicrobium minutum]MDH6531767.1 dTDP-4-dehydrorhamnose reductase [Aurantimicrobium minutum]
MRFVVTGARGMLGSDLTEILRDRDVLALGHAELDVTDLDAVRNVILPNDVIINCAAYTRVDDAESHEDEAFAINAVGVKNLAIVARESKSRLITISSDYVFGGNAISPYSENELQAPISAYGRSKASGEKFALDIYPEGTFIVRSAWMYGKYGANFAQTMLNLANTKDTWAVVDDQLGQPTWSVDLAHQILLLVESNAPAGIYHATNTGQTTWHEFAKVVLQEAGLDPSRITPTDSGSFTRPAPRPAYSVLGQGHWSEAGLSPMRSWRAALHDAFESGVFTWN